MRIWEWVGQAADEPARSQGTMHSKFAVFDAERSLVGSYNLDPRSEKLNSETAIVFLQAGSGAATAHEVLDEDLRYAREVDARRGGPFEAPDRVIERFRKSLGQLFDKDL